MNALQKRFKALLGLSVALVLNVGLLGSDFSQSIDKPWGQLNPYQKVE